MNDFNELGNRHGYWITSEVFEPAIGKGFYENGNKIGVWEFFSFINSTKNKLLISKWYYI